MNGISRRDYTHGQCIECDADAEWTGGNHLSCPECGGEWDAKLVDGDETDRVRFVDDNGEIAAVVELESRGDRDA
jgi:uncharacterized Zn ribbon protein